MSARDFADLSRERVDDDLHGDEYRRRAIERADRLREVSDVADMSWPTADIAMERVRPAVRNDDEALAPMLDEAGCWNWNTFDVQARIDGLVGDRLIEDERADRLREVSDVADMSWPTADIAMERVRPAVRNDDEALAPMRGLLIGLVIGFALWAAVVLVALVAA